MTVLIATGFATAGFAGGDYGHKDKMKHDKPVEQTQTQEPAQNDQPYFSDFGSESVLGTVTLVGNNVMKIHDSASGLEHEIRISESQERELTTGYMVDARVKDGKLVEYRQLSIPSNVEEIVYNAENLS